MAGLALLFAGSHEVERALGQCGSGILVGCHRALLEVLLGLLVPVAGVAGVVDLVEGYKLERRPLVAVDAGAADVDCERQLRRAQTLDAAQHVGAVADEHRGRRQLLRRGHRAGGVVHTTGTGILVLQLLAVGSLGSQEDGTVLEGDIVGVVGARLVAQFHGQADLYLVALGPVAADGGIAGGALLDGDVNGLTVDRNGKALAHPLRVTDGHGVVAGLADGEGRRLLVGEGGLLGDDEVVTHEKGGGEEVDVEGLVGVVGVDEVTVLGVVLHARAHAAPHALVHL